MTPDLFGRSVGRPHDALDRFFTPDALAVACCDALVELGVDAARIIEPSAGGGAFVRAVRRAWPRAHIRGIDADPAAEGLALCDVAHIGDWPSLAPELCAGLVIGNPPFSGNVAIPHVEAALDAAPVVALILPWAPLGGVDRWARLMDRRRPEWALPIRPRPWPASVRETALYVWRGRPSETRVRWLPPWR